MKKFFAWMTLIACCILAVCVVCGVVLLVDVINRAGTLPYLAFVGVLLLLVGYAGVKKTK